MLTAAGAFSATNLDDIVILTLLFSRLDQQLRLLHVVVGQLLGFTLLVLVSLAPLLGRSLLPLPWLGLLGLLPISLGVSGLLDLLPQASSQPSAPSAVATTPTAADPFQPLAVGSRAGALASVLAVASLTAANGSDNIGVYLPLFAQATPAELAVMLFTFALGLGLWFLLAWWLTRLEGLAQALRRWGARLTPPLLMVLGLLVLFDSRCLEEPALALIALLCLAVLALSLLRPLQTLADASAPFTPPAADVGHS